MKHATVTARSQEACGNLGFYMNKVYNENHVSSLDNFMTNFVHRTEADNHFRSSFYINVHCWFSFYRNESFIAWLTYTYVHYCILSYNHRNQKRLASVQSQTYNLEIGRRSWHRLFMNKRFKITSSYKNLPLCCWFVERIAERLNWNISWPVKFICCAYPSIILMFIVCIYLYCF